MSMRARLSRLGSSCLLSGKMRSSETGSAVVEVAFVLAVFGPLLILGTAEAGSLVYASIEVSNAAHAGALYGMRSSTYASDTAGMTSAAQQEAVDFGTKLNATPTTFYACSAALGGTQYATQSAATNACTGSGNHALQMVQVNVSMTFTPAIHLPAFASSFSLTATSVLEVAE
jgi:Flp pilus assembly protein TadG